MADPFVLMPVADPMIGMAIGSFVIIRVLGRGGMGAVYLAQHKAAAHIRCVFKTILTHLSNNPLMISRFHTETEAVGRVKHENIVELKDFGVLPNGQMYMQFEFIDGTPLDRFLAEWGGRLSLHRAAYLAFQVCDALDHAHANGVVHRDLKPENLMVVVQDKKRVPRLVKLVDFGVSKVVRAGEVQTMSGMKMGTPYFMSVEQYANAAEATGKSDVYSLAIVLWQLITGDLPWGHPDPNVLYHVQRTETPTAPPESVMPVAVSKLLLRCLSVEPDDRPTMQELAVELAAVIPATDDAPSGGAILLHIAPHFLASSPDHTRTMPRAALANPDLVAAQLWPPVGIAAVPVVQSDREVRAGRGDAGSGQIASPQLEAAANGASRSAQPPAVLHQFTPAGVTPDARPNSSRETVRAAPASSRSSGAAAPGRESFEPAPPPTATSASYGGTPADATSPRGPVVAALPTGLISQRHDAQDAPIELLSGIPRVRSVVAAAEIDLASGTSGPNPYAHAELPRVVISTTLSYVTPSPGGAASADAPAEPPPCQEPPPRLVLPDVARAAARRKHLRTAVAVAAAVLAALTSFALVRSMTTATRLANDADRASPIVARDTPAGSPAAPDVGASPPVARSTESLATAAARPASTVEAEQLAPALDIGSRTASSASSSTNAPSTPVSSPPSSSTLRAAGGSPPSEPKPAPPVAARKGELVVEVESWAIIWLNGKQDEAPYRAPLPAGRYRLRMQHEDKDETTIVFIRPNETTTVKRDW